MKALFIAVVLIAGLPGNAFSQKWIKTLPMIGYPSSLQQEKDSGFLLTMNLSGTLAGVFCKLDKNGEILWNKFVVDTNRLSAGTRSADGGFILAGMAVHPDRDGGGCLIKLNACGEREWLTDFYAREYGWMDNTFSLSDSGFICYGPNYGNNYFKVFRVDKKGKLLWEYSHARFQPRNIIELPDKGFIIAGSGYFYDDGNKDYSTLRSLILRLDAGGKLIWIRPYGINTDFISDICECQLTERGEILCVGCHRGEIAIQNGEQPVMFKYDMNGNLIWKRLFGNKGYDEVMNRACSLGNSGFAIIGDYIDSQNNNQPEMLLADTAGRLIKTRRYPMNEITKPISVCRTFNGGYAIALTNHNKSNYSTMVIKVKADLEPDSFDHFGTPKYDPFCNKAIKSDTIDLGNPRVYIIDTAVVGIKPNPPGAAPNILLYPNPATERLYIQSECSSTANTTFSISDISGRQVYLETIPQGQQKTEINTAKWPGGLYFLTLNSENEAFVPVRRKFVVVK